MYKILFDRLVAMRFESLTLYILSKSLIIKLLIVALKKNIRLRI